jgi:hypothetical protein
MPINQSPDVTSAYTPGLPAFQYLLRLSDERRQLRLASEISPSSCSTAVA